MQIAKTLGGQAEHLAYLDAYVWVKDYLMRRVCLDTVEQREGIRKEWENLKFPAKQTREDVLRSFSP